MEGDEVGGFTIFYADDGLDTGPILLTKDVKIEPNETVDTIYNRFLYPEGIKGMVRNIFTLKYINMHFRSGNVKSQTFFRGILS